MTCDRTIVPVGRSMTGECDLWLDSRIVARKSVVRIPK